MGRSTEAASVPFKISSVATVCHTGGKILSKSDEFKNFIKKVINNEDEEDEVTYKFNNWEVEDLCSQDFSLFSTKLVKNEMSIYIINESEYSNIGERDYCIFSKEESHMEEFCKDYKLNFGEIETNTTVMQTL